MLLALQMHLSLPLSCKASPAADSWWQVQGGSALAWRHLCLTATPYVPFPPPALPYGHTTHHPATPSNTTTLALSHPSSHSSVPSHFSANLPPAPVRLRRALLNNSLKGIVVVCVLLPLWFLASDRIGLGPSSSIWAPAPAWGHGMRSNDRRMMVRSRECEVEGHGNWASDMLWEWRA